MLMEDGRRIGHTFSQPDLLIAAIAINHGLTVVTRDVGQFEKARVQVFSPWAS
jgi:predicted nucleic acid-binding protein